MRLQLTLSVQGFIRDSVNRFNPGVRPPQVVVGDFLKVVFHSGGFNPQWTQLGVHFPRFVHLVDYELAVAVAVHLTGGVLGRQFQTLD